MYLAKLHRLLVRCLALIIQLPRITLYRLLSNNMYSGNPHIYQPIQIVGLGKVIFASNVKIGVLSSPNFFSSYTYIEAREDKSMIFIDSGTWINNNFSAIAEHTSIKIGKNCLIGIGVSIIDSDFHGLNVNERYKSIPERAKEVVIADNVFIGSYVNILKGVKIGTGSVIASGSVVTKNIPDNVIAGGNPASVIRKIDSR